MSRTFSSWFAALTSARHRSLPLAACVLVVLVAYAFVAGCVLYIPGDTYFSAFPMFASLSSALKSGALPLWEPFVRRGVPLSDLLGLPIWSPLTLLFGLIGYTLELINAQYLTIVVLGAASMYMALARWVTERWIRAAGAIAYVTSGIYIGNSQHLTFISVATLFPFVHYSAFRWLESRGSKRAALKLGAGLALLVTNGYPPFIVMVLFFLVLEAVVSGSMERSWRAAPWRRWVASAGVCALSAVALSWVALVTTLQISTRTVRASAIPWEDVANNGLHPLNWVAVISPALVELIPRWTYYLEPSMRNTYIAAPVVLLFLASPFVLHKVMKDRMLGALLLLATLSGLFTLGGHTPVYKWIVYDALPLMNLYRFPAGLRFFAFFYVVVLACACAEGLARSHTERHFDVMKALWLAALATVAVLLHSGTTPTVVAEVSLSLAGLLLLVIALERRWTSVTWAVFAATSVFAVLGAWRNPDHGLGSAGRPTGYDAALAALYHGDGESRVRNTFVPPTIFGAFNVIERSFETAGYIGTLELRPYHAARVAGLLPRPGDPVLSSVPEVAVQTKDGVVVSNPASFEGASSAPSELRVRPGQIAAAVNLPTRSYVFLEQNIYPGWKAYVDGVEQPLVPTEAGTLALSVEKGPHEILFAFRPVAVIVSFWLTLSAWVIACLVGLAALRGHSGPRPPRPAALAREDSSKE